MAVKVAAIVGPTAVGKTETSLRVAEALDAEIVSVDSMQIYRGMDIGTDKPTLDMLERVPHHLIDLRDPDHELTVAEYRDLARAAIVGIAERGKLPLLVGGSGLYLRAIVDELRFPPRAEEVRSVLEAEAEEVGAGALHARLQELDPKAASRIEPGNARRTIRALEVIEITGAPFSDNDSWDVYDSIYTLAVAGLERERGDLYERVAQRVDRMIERGLLDEVGSLKDRLGRTARQALGYKQVLEGPGAEVRDEIVRATKRFARRQESWFRSDPRVRWFDAAGKAVADEIVSFFREALTLPLSR